MGAEPERSGAPAGVEDATPVVEDAHLGARTSRPLVVLRARCPESSTRTHHPGKTGFAPPSVSAAVSDPARVDASSRPGREPAGEPVNRPGRPGRRRPAPGWRPGNL